MSAAKHAPGPWVVLPSAQQGQFVILTEHGPRKDIACTYGFPADPREANARLIAAAPELLEALQMLYDETADYIRLNNLGGMDNQCMQLARAAIAKATGAAT